VAEFDEDGCPASMASWAGAQSAMGKIRFVMIGEFDTRPDSETPQCPSNELVPPKM
jgi:hypothetical protein